MVAIAGDDALCPTCGQAYAAPRTMCPNDGTKLIVRRAQAQPLTGRSLAGKFLVGPLLGEGMLGAVYVGRQAGVDREVAIKVIKPSLVADPAAADRLFVAAQTACRMSGPCVATGLDVGRTEDGIVYVVSEIARGRTLAAELTDAGKLPNYRAVPIAIQLCDALITGQTSAMIAHGDLKPNNIFVADDGRGAAVKVADFALARALHPDPWAMPAAFAQYTAPELGQEGRPVDVRSDLYALGCILYEMLSGRPAFSGGSTRELLEKHERELPPRLPREVQPTLATVVMCLLQKRPEDRFGTPQEVKAVLLPLNPTASSVGSIPPPINDPAAAYFATQDRTSQLTTTGSTAGPTPASGSHAASGIYHPKTGAQAQPAGVPIYHPKTGPQPQPAGVPIYHPRTGAHTQPQVLAERAAAQQQPQLYQQPQPDYQQPIATTPPPMPEPPSPAGGMRRLVVIALVVLVLAGGGIVAYLAATGAL